MESSAPGECYVKVFFPKLETLGGVLPREKVCAGMLCDSVSHGQRRPRAARLDGTGPSARYEHTHARFRA